MSTLFEVPLIQGPQAFFIDLSGTTYQITLTYRDLTNADMLSGQGGWLMDIGDASAAPIVVGIPLVTGTDLIQPYTDLALPPGGLYVASEGQHIDEVPTFESLGVTTRMYYLAP